MFSNTFGIMVSRVAEWQERDTNPLIMGVIETVIKRKKLVHEAQNLPNIDPYLYTLGSIPSTGTK